MRQFLAILRDSFREAVDGFVIYLMLALSGVLILVLASLSFTPVPAEKVIPSVVERFLLFIPDRGQSWAVAGTQGVTYSAGDIRQTGRDVSFRLTAKETGGGLAGWLTGDRDAFRRTVAAWAKPAGPTQKLKRPVNRGRGKADPAGEVEFANKIDVTPEEAAAVTDEAMADFVRDQFHTHLGTDRAAVRRVPGTPAGTYQFDVEILGVTAARGWPQEVALFFGGMRLGEFPLGQTVALVENVLVNWAGSSVALLIAVIITAFFVPNMVRKGALDLLVAKPISRARLLVFKYLGGLTFILLLTGFTVGGVWVVLGLRSGHWDPRYLLTVPALVFTFALLYAVSALVAVFTRSAIAAILVTLAFTAGLYFVGLGKSLADGNRATDPPLLGEWPEWVYVTIDGLNRGLPRYSDLGKLTSRLTTEGTFTPIEARLTGPLTEFPAWGEVIGLSVAYIALFLGVACWRFTTRDG